MTKYATACGGTINISSLVESHLQAHPDVFSVLQEAIEKISLPTNAIRYEREIDLGRFIGRAGIVRTIPLKLEDSALFALRTNRRLPSRVAPIGEIGEQTKKMVVLARTGDSEKQYELITAWVGTLAKKEPCDRSITSLEDFQASLEFWSTYALVYDPVVMGTVFESNWKNVLTSSKSPFL